MDIQLNFINRSNDANNSEVVIFQKNAATSFDELAVAWKVIQNCGQGSHHPFVYSLSTSVAASDAYGNFTSPLPASHGTAFRMVMTPSGDMLQQADHPAVSPEEIEVMNALDRGAIGAYVYRSGSVCAQKTGIAPMQKAVFQFEPTIWIGVVSQAQEGGVIDSSVLSEINTEINLLGIVRADIVMTGGGTGVNAEPFRFTLENVQYE